MEKYNVDAMKATGIPVVDQQHRELFERLTSFLDVAKSSDSPEKFKEMLDFFIRYMALHFSTEEDLMLMYGYPELVEHKKIHDTFRGKVFMFKEHFERDGFSEDIVEELKVNIIDWFVGHVQEIDQKYAPFIVQRMKNKKDLEK